MTHPLSALAALAALALAAGSTPGAVPARPPITGRVTGGDAGALPKDALVRVWLESAPARHQAARRLSETTFSAAGRRLPIPFSLPAPAADLDPAVPYQLRAVISSGKSVLFWTRVPAPAPTGVPPSPVDIAVEAFGAARPQVTVSSTSVGLSGSWRLVTLPRFAAPVPRESAAPTLDIAVPKKQISGSTGCNQYFGACVIGEAGALSLQPAGSTLKACPDDVSALETAFLAALRETTAYRISGSRLEFLAGDRVLARFERPRPGAASD